VEQISWPNFGAYGSTSALMALSGGAAIAVVFLNAAPLWLRLPVHFAGGSLLCLTRPSSRRPSPSAPLEYVGTALTIQTLLDFLLAIDSIQFVRIVVVASDWPGASLMLAASPIVGITAMLSLRRLTEAAPLAEGKRR